MEHEDGYCDGCGCALAECWLTFYGEQLCRDCAVSGLQQSVAVARKPEARDDGR